MGISETFVPNEPSKKYAVFFHGPDIIEAQDIQMAVGIASAKAEQQWPKENGWIKRSVAVEPFGPSSIRQMLTEFQSGLLAHEHEVTPETGIVVDLDKADTQSSVIIETDKPPF